MPKDRLFSLLKAATPTVDLGPSFAESTECGRPPEEAIEERSPNWSHEQVIALLSPPLPVKGSAKERFYGFLLPLRIRQSVMIFWAAAPLLTDY